MNFISKLSKFQLPFLMGFRLYFDFGTSKTEIAIKDKGIVLKEATALGFNKRIHEYIFFGNEARAIIGKVPDFISIVHPMVNGVISDFDGQVALIKKFISRGVSPYRRSQFIRLNFAALSAVPSIATEIEQKAVEEVLFKAGASQAHLIEKPLANAVGAGFNIFAHRPIFIIDLGGGLIEIAIISGGGIVIQKTLKTGGENMNKLIANYCYLKHGIVLGDITCNELKEKLFNFVDKDTTMVVRGKSLETGLPKSVKIKSSDIKEALLPQIHQVIDAAKEVVEAAPPEVIDAVYESGIILVGGLAQIPGLDSFMARELKLETHAYNHPEDTTIRGLVKIGESREMLSKLKIHLP